MHYVNQYKYLSTSCSIVFRLIHFTSFFLLMGQIQLIQESITVFHLFLLCFSPLLPFLYFELVARLINKNDDNDSGSRINFSAFKP